jgi:hypothetical protein
MLLELILETILIRPASSSLALFSFSMRSAPVAPSPDNDKGDSNSDDSDDDADDKSVEADDGWGDENATNDEELCLRGSRHDLVDLLTSLIHRPQGVSGPGWTEAF